MTVQSMTEAAATRIGVREFRANLSRYLKQAEQGAHFAVVSHDKVVAELHPPPPASEYPCTFGALKGQIWMAPGWDQPDEELIDIMLNSPIFPDDVA
jgi:antitoxin (DNA-binding transcriptional repressor) of toxin-antitoxin stability system